MLDETRRGRIESAYATFVEFCKTDSQLATALAGEPFFQGSFSYQTIIRPTQQIEFDVDIIYPFSLEAFGYPKPGPREILNWFVGRLRERKDYADKLIQKPRCARLNYAGDFHLDIIPSTRQLRDHQPYAVPTRDLGAWITNDPVGVAHWVKQLDDRSGQADTDNENRFRRSVRMLKRWRDVSFKSHEAPSSILLLTMLGKHEASAKNYNPPMQDPLFPKYSFDAAYIYDMVRLTRSCIVLRGDQSFLHPTITNENLAAGWQEGNLNTFIKGLDELIASLQRAIWSETEAESIRFYRGAFGDSFPAK